MFLRYYSTSNNLRKLICPRDLNTDVIRKILWTAFEMERLHSISKNLLFINILRDYSAIVLSHKPHMHIHIPLLKATKMLGIRLRIVNDPFWYQQNCVEDVGRYISNFCDVILYSSRLHRKVEKFVEGATVPVICVQSCRFTMVQTLIDLMSIQKRFGYLRGLTIAWLGPACKELNTFLLVAPLLDIHMKYCCGCCQSDMQSPASLDEALKVIKGDVKLTECTTMEAAIENAHVIISKEPEKFKTPLTPDSFKGAHEEWVYFHHFPRQNRDIDNKLFHHEKCLTWQSVKNSTWIYMSLLVRALNDNYTFITKEPDF